MPVEPGAQPRPALFERKGSEPAAPPLDAAVRSHAEAVPPPRPPRPGRRSRARPAPVPPPPTPRTRVAALSADPPVGGPRRRAFGWLIAVVVLGLIGGLGAYGVATSGFFRVREVTVRGADLVAPLDISAATAAVGVDLLHVDPAAVRQRVEQAPGVKRAEVRRVFPRSLVVTITERTPAAVWQMGGVAYAVDDEGIVLDVSPDPALPVVYRVDSVDGLAAGDRVDADAVRLAARLKTVGGAPLGQRVVRLEWTQRFGMEAVTDQNVRVRLGDSSALDFKLEVWRSVLDQARKDKTTVREIDLRFGDRIVYR